MKDLKKFPYYPPTVGLILMHERECVRDFKTISPYPGGIFVGLTVIEGTFLLDNQKELAESLFVGEELLLSPEKGKLKYNPVTVKRKNGEMLGYLPNSAAITVHRVFALGEGFVCRVECFELTANLLSVGVSLYININRY